MKAYGVAFAVLAALGGCASPDELRLLSAGRTGCQPQDNKLSNVSTQALGTTWNATCKGKVYLCTRVVSSDAAASTSCAPAAQ
jgi:hypothetical protein